jgi:hypothetical protein
MQTINVRGLPEYGLTVQNTASGDLTIFGLWPYNLKNKA